MTDPKIVSNAVSIKGEKPQRANRNPFKHCQCGSKDMMTKVVTDLCWVCYRLRISARTDFDVQGESRVE